MHSRRRPSRHPHRRRKKKRSKLQKRMRGQINEDRFRDIARGFLSNLPKEYAHINYVGLDKSPPRSVADKSGCDFDIIIDTYRDGKFQRYRIIYDVKSSVVRAIRFNTKIIILPGQKSANLKKAIVVNDRKPASVIKSEIKSDLILVGVLPDTT